MEISCKDVFRSIDNNVLQIGDSEILKVLLHKRKFLDKTSNANILNVTMSFYFKTIILALLNILLSILLLNFINNQQGHVSYNMGEIKQSRFTSTYQSLRAFEGHRLHYQVHIKTNLKQFARID